jgi:hypothetical protein
MLSVIMLRVVMLSVIMVGVVMMNVVATFLSACSICKLQVIGADFIHI